MAFPTMRWLMSTAAGIDVTRRASTLARYSLLIAISARGGGSNINRNRKACDMSTHDN
jgi:hypothetical protein